MLLLAMSLLSTPADAGPVRRAQVRAQAELPRPDHRVTTQVLSVTMSDGVPLVGTLYQPKGVGPSPVILLRTPYGRRNWHTHAQVMAGQGFAVFIQDVRGTGASGGEYTPMLQEVADGGDTVDWMQQQPWFNGELFLWGGSYLTYTQWATQTARPDAVTAMVNLEGGPLLYPMSFPNGVTNLDLATTWTWIMDILLEAEGHVGLKEGLEIYTGWDDLAFDTLPLTALDDEVTGQDWPQFNHTIVAVDLTGARWAAQDLSASVNAQAPPVMMVSGWQDIGLEAVMLTYDALREQGRQPPMVLGPWTHANASLWDQTLGDALGWFGAHRDGGSADAGEVRYFELGSEQWRSTPSWPPPGSTMSLWMNTEGALVQQVPAQGQTGWRYDPADPTPSLGGPRLFVQEGVVDNGPLEARADTVTFSTPTLEQPLRVAGRPVATLTVSADQPSADVFVRLNRVDASGRSTNLTEGIARVDFTQQGQAQTVTVPLRPTAFVLQPGEQLRVVLASGSFPQYARNLGVVGAQAQATATEGRVTQVTLEHGESQIALPVVTATP